MLPYNPIWLKGKVTLMIPSYGSFIPPYAPPRPADRPHGDPLRRELHREADGAPGLRHLHHQAQQRRVRGSGRVHAQHQR